MHPVRRPAAFRSSLTFALLCTASLVACGGGSDEEVPTDTAATSSTADSGSGAAPAGAGTGTASAPAAQPVAATSTGTSASTPSPIPASSPAPAPAQATSSCSGFSQSELLSAINAARAQARQCGSTSMPVVASLARSSSLADAARRHSHDMASRNFFSHTGSDGSDVGQRASEAGYEWSAVGENISGGPSSVSSVMSGWLASAGHCSNIMRASYQQVGVACVSRAGSTYTRYWTMVLARP